MKKISIIFAIICSILLTVYLSFLFAIPKYVNFNKYIPNLEKAVFEKTDIQINLKQLKITTSWDLALSAEIEKTDLLKNNEKFAQINNLKIKIALLPLIFKKICLTNIDATKFMANIKNDNFTSSKKDATINKNSFTLSENLPDIKIDNYRISLLEKDNNYTFKGKDLHIWDFVLNKRIKFQADGKVILNGKEHINYDIKLSSLLFPNSSQESSDEKDLTIYDCLNNLIKYKVFCNITSDLSISGTIDEPAMKGKLGINDLIFTCEGKNFPPSSIVLGFNKDKISVDSILQIDKTSCAKINGDIFNGKSKALNLRVYGDNIKIEELSLIIKTVSKSFGIEETQAITMKGSLKADFNVKSDLKKITSDGFLKIKNGSLYHKVHNIKINDINTDIDFSNNFIKIRKADAKFMSYPINISGVIDTNANANIKVCANNLQLKEISKTIRNKFVQENDINGLLEAKIVINGQLKSVTPEISAVIKDFKAINKKTKETFKIFNTNINASGNKIFNAKINMYNLNYSPDSQSSILIPRLVLNLTDKNATMEKTTLWINNIKTDLSGSISNIYNSPSLNNVTINIPNYVTVPLKGYQGSRLTLKGDLKLNGSINKPVFNGLFSIPSVSIPTLSLTLKDASIKASDKILFSCPYIKVANSIFNTVAEIDSDFSKGIAVKNLNLNTTFVNINEVENALKKQKIDNFIVENGKFNADVIKLQNMFSENINANIHAKNNILYIKNLTGTAYTGKIAGNINYDINNQKTLAKLQGRNLSAKLVIPIIINRNDDISGKLDFDSIVTFKGSSPKDIRKSLNGKTSFQILNGKMGTLGKLEHLLYAQNIMADSLLKASLNVATRAVTVKNTGVYKYLRGNITFTNGIANIKSIKTTGPSMSLYMTGKLFLSDNLAIMTIFGRISNDVANVLGPIGEFTMQKALASILKIPDKTPSKRYITETDYENFMQIPPLTPKTNFKTREFRVLINGDLYKQSSVRSFEWLIQPNNKNTEIIKSNKKQAETQREKLPDFVKRLPDYK